MKFYLSGNNFTQALLVKNNISDLTHKVNLDLEIAPRRLI